MTSQVAMDVLRQALMMTFWLSLPLLMVGFVAGIVISLVQIVTSIQDPAFGAVPRLAAFTAAFIVVLPWMLNKLVFYTIQLFGDFGKYAR